MPLLTGKANAIVVGQTSATALAPVGSRFLDVDGNEYMYVGASGVAIGAPVKFGATPDLSTLISGTTIDVEGVATQAFGSTAFSYGLIGVRGIHPTRVPSGTAANTVLQGGSGTTAAASAGAVQCKIGVSMATAANDGGVVNVYWF